MTPTGTNLLGLVKHLAGVEAGYLGDCVGRPSPESAAVGTMTERSRGRRHVGHREETREWLLDLYRRSRAHSDNTIRALGLEATGRQCPGGREGRPDTTFGTCWSTSCPRPRTTPATPTSCANHRRGRRAPTTTRSATQEHWTAFVAKIQEAADTFR